MDKAPAPDASQRQPGPRPARAARVLLSRRHSARSAQPHEYRADHVLVVQRIDAVVGLAQVADGQITDAYSPW
jgi:hypothetical protein